MPVAGGGAVGDPVGFEPGGDLQGIDGAFAELAVPVHECLHGVDGPTPGRAGLARGDGGGVCDLGGAGDGVGLGVGRGLDFGRFRLGLRPVGAQAVRGTGRLRRVDGAGGRGWGPIRVRGPVRICGRLRLRGRRMLCFRTAGGVRRLGRRRVRLRGVRAFAPVRAPVPPHEMPHDRRRPPLSGEAGHHRRAPLPGEARHHRCPPRPGCGQAPSRCGDLRAPCLGDQCLRVGVPARVGHRCARGIRCLGRAAAHGGSSVFFAKSAGPVDGCTPPARPRVRLLLTHRRPPFAGRPRTRPRRPSSGCARW